MEIAYRECLLFNLDELVKSTKCKHLPIVKTKKWDGFGKDYLGRRREDKMPAFPE